MEIHPALVEEPQRYNKLMRRLISITILGAVALAPLAAQAQRGGMGGRSSGFARGPVAARAPMAAPRGPAFAPRPMGGPGVVSAPAGARTFVSPGHVVFSTVRFPGRFHRHFHNPFFFHNCFTFPCNNGFFFGTGFGLGSPFGFGWGYPYSSYPYYPSDYYPQAAQAQPVVTDNGASTQLAVEMQRLSDEVQDLKEDLRNENRQANAAQPPLPAGCLSAQPPAASTTFVFRDGHHVVTQNYIITGQTLWIFNEHTAKKISLADLDRAATEQVNAANGVDVHIPEPR